MPDGDTPYVELNCTTPFFCADRGIRIRNFNAYEIDDKNASKRVLAEKQRDKLAQILSNGKVVIARNCDPKKWSFQRIVCDIEVDGVDIVNLMNDI